MKLPKFIKEIYEGAALFVEIPVALVQMSYDGIKRMNYSKAEIKRIANNINPNKVKIIEKLEKLNTEEEFTALVCYYPSGDNSYVESSEAIQIAYKDKRYIIFGNDFNFENVETYELKKEGYEIGFNHEYDAKQFLTNSQPIKLVNLAQFIETKMQQKENESTQRFEKRVNQMYDSVDAKFDLSIFKEKALLEDIISDVEAQEPVKKIRHKI
jgi:hypothetical protein